MEKSSEPKATPNPMRGVWAGLIIIAVALVVLWFLVGFDVFGKSSSSGTGSGADAAVFARADITSLSVHSLEGQSPIEVKDDLDMLGESGVTNASHLGLNLEPALTAETAAALDTQGNLKPNTALTFGSNDSVNIGGDLTVGGTIHDNLRVRDEIIELAVGSADRYPQSGVVVESNSATRFSGFIYGANTVEGSGGMFTMIADDATKPTPSGTPPAPSGRFRAGHLGASVGVDAPLVDTQAIANTKGSTVSVNVDLDMTNGAISNLSSLTLSGNISAANLPRVEAFTTSSGAQPMDPQQVTASFSPITSVSARDQLTHKNVERGVSWNSNTLTIQPTRGWRVLPGVTADTIVGVIYEEYRPYVYYANDGDTSIQSVSVDPDTLQFSPNTAISLGTDTFNASTAFQIASAPIGGGNDPAFIIYTVNANRELKGNSWSGSNISFTGGPYTDIGTFSTVIDNKTGDCYLAFTYNVSTNPAIQLMKAGLGVTTFSPYTGITGFATSDQCSVAVTMMGGDAALYVLNATTRTSTLYFKDASGTQRTYSQNIAGSLVLLPNTQCVACSSDFHHYPANVASGFVYQGSSASQRKPTVSVMTFYPDGTRSLEFGTSYGFSEGPSVELQCARNQPDGISVVFGRASSVFGNYLRIRQDKKSAHFDDLYKDPVTTDPSFQTTVSSNHIAFGRALVTSPPRIYFYDATRTRLNVADLDFSSPSGPSANGDLFEPQSFSGMIV